MPQEGVVQRAGQDLRLTRHEQRLLDALIARRGQWVSTERLLHAIYDDPDHASDAGLKNHVLRLRRKIGRDEIYNNYGLGYMLRPVAED